MLATNELEAIGLFEEVRRASEYDAIDAVIVMKDRPGAFINEFDDDLLCYLQMVPRRVVRRLPSEWLAKYRGKKLYPKYENVEPIVAELVSSALRVRLAEKDGAGHLMVKGRLYGIGRASWHGSLKFPIGNCNEARPMAIWRKVISLAVRKAIWSVWKSMHVAANESPL